MWADYAAPSRTFRKSLHGILGKLYLPDEHQVAKFRYNKLKETAEIDAFGNATINRAPEEEEQIVNGLKDLKVSEKVAEVELKV
jgi:hypothetical protein